MKFRINGDLRINAVLRDNLRTPIPANEFCTIVQNYKNSGSFYVHLEYDVIRQNPALITIEVSSSGEIIYTYTVSQLKFYCVLCFLITVELETVFNQQRWWKFTARTIGYRRSNRQKQKTADQ